MDRAKGSGDGNGGGIEQNRRFKKAILDVLFQYCETFYIHCMPHPDLVIGRRGLVDREQSEGIVLVFGPYSTRQLSWDDKILYCELQFNRWEPVSIPYESIARMFDKDGQVIMQWSAQAPDAMDSGAGRGPLGGPRRSGSTGPQRSSSVREDDSASARAPAADSGDKPEDSPGRVIEVDFTRRRKEEEGRADHDAAADDGSDDDPENDPGGRRA